VIAAVKIVKTDQREAEHWVTKTMWLNQIPVTGSKDIVITCIIVQLTVDVDDKTGTLIVTTNCIIVTTVVSVHYQLLVVHVILCCLVTVVFLLVLDLFRRSSGHLSYWCRN